MCDTHQCPTGRVKASARQFAEPPASDWLYTPPHQIGWSEQVICSQNSYLGHLMVKAAPSCVPLKKNKTTYISSITPHGPALGRERTFAECFPYAIHIWQFPNACRYGRIWSFYHDAILILSKTWRWGSKRARIQTLYNLTLRTHLLPPFHYHISFAPGKCQCGQNMTHH